MKVMTFEAIDGRHGFEPGTSTGEFFEHRRRFNEGEDYIVIEGGSIRITLPGYLNLTHVMDDEHSWRVRRHVVDTVLGKSRSCIFDEIFGEAWDQPAPGDEWKTGRLSEGGIV